MRNSGTLLETANEYDDFEDDSTNRRIGTSKAYNPFKVPETTDYFRIRDEEKEERELKRAKISMTPLSQRVLESKRANLRRQCQPKVTNPDAEEKALAKIILNPQRGRTKEGLRDFISQKREIFLAQLAIDTKREELQRLERLEIEEKKQLKEKEAEINLFRTQFNNFLENDGKQTMMARQEAENKAKERIELSLQIKTISAQISGLRNEIAHQDERLQECQEYKQFLNMLTPEEWKKTHSQDEMYFQKPEQLLTIIQSLEEQNMFLIHHCQDAEEAVERYRAKFAKLLDQRDGHITEMTDKFNEASENLRKHQEKNESYFNNKEFKTGAELSEKEAQVLHDKIAAFYQVLGYDSGSSTDTSAMLVRIEETLQQLIKDLKHIQPEIVRKKAQEKDSQRREKLRLERQAETKRKENEKRMKTLREAKQPIKYKTGRPLVPRHIPKRGISKQEAEEKAKMMELEEQKDRELLFGDIWD
ncbi:hypothetical protein TVAG_090350 [Trichomonas vaginalis G3]|uniref:DUF4200 domain-containing protein n=1 Tax=Trichomonas vaginalis (strain ATCC PRA-98 / G3) TaxID=412133 RepID=A2F9Z2_TRIV3|nr:inner dynein arm assembly [Trichomonas vaginalis G3]EAX98259.1 hypothetical protein TVAG_090350 [Trichomonas vaginalis G3]KAI5511185.1 inner dynein arm assembly [Trichomonas vaginalis G3]|eukprot:XP_001311189.1 hypothetical protein [Trichomonas vaginalis G3]